MARPTPPPQDVKALPSDHIKRGQYKSTPVGTTAFVGLRALDPFFQYKLLAGAGASFLSRLGASTIAAAVPAFHTGLAGLDSLGLPLQQLVLLGMSVGTAAKQIYWILAVSNEEFPLQFAPMVAGYNTFMNSVNTLLFVAAATSSSLASPQVPVPGTGQTVSLTFAAGTVVYIVGIILETLSEIQRKRFKSRPENEGKICTAGLWTWARHINYTGYTMWRTGYALAAGGWIPAALVLAFQGYALLQNGVGNLDGYMTEKYGLQWTQYKTDVPWKMVPGIY